MSYTLNEIEGMDRILMTMAVYDPDADMPVQEEAQSSESALTRPSANGVYL